jgi:hypothetical protein
VERKEIEKRCVVREPPKGGCMLLRYLFHSIIVLIGKQKGEKEMSSDVTRLSQ